MATPLCLFTMFALTPGAWANEQYLEECHADDCQLSLVQTSKGWKHRRAGGGSLLEPTQVAPSHFWPHSRGRVGKYAQTYDMPADLNLSAALAWNWTHPDGLGALIWGALIDDKKNLYICGAGAGGTIKLSPDGQQLWRSAHGGENCVLDGPALYGMHQTVGLMYALDLHTGQELWTKMVSQKTGLEGDMVEAYRGVVLAGVGQLDWPGDGGKPSRQLLAVNSSTGDELWTFEPTCGLWNVDAMFPDEETTVIMDMCGGVYRLGLYNGSLLWRQYGSANSFTDGGAALDSEGNMYTCSSPENSDGVEGQGVVRKYRKSDGKKLWETLVESPCVNFPAVMADDSTLVIAPGGLASDAKTKEMKLMDWSAGAQEFYRLQLELVEQNKQRAFYGMPDLTGAMLGLDTATGKLRWRHDVEPWGGVAFALDEERAWNSKHLKSLLPHCWPSHWSGALTDAQGRVYLGRSTGDLYAYDPKTDTEQKFRTHDGILMGGLSSAPGMLVVSTCSLVYVFKF